MNKVACIAYQEQAWFKEDSTHLSRLRKGRVIAPGVRDSNTGMIVPGQKMKQPPNNM